MQRLALIALVCGLPIRAAISQVTATVDAGFSVVRYDGFLASGAGSITPAVRWEHPQGRGFVSARGTYLRFESGNRSLDGSLNGAVFGPLARHWQGEIAVAAGASNYAEIASFRHGVAAARLHFLERRHGAWFGASGGRASYGTGSRPVSVATVGAWAVRRNLTVLASADRSFIGDTAYTDVRTSARIHTGGVAIDFGVGARFWSRGAGRGVYGEGSLNVPVGTRTTIVISGGRYPTDVVSGSIAGRYVATAIRIGTSPGRESRPVVVPYSRPIDVGARGGGGGGGGGGGANGAADVARIELRSVADGALLFIHAPAATLVEIAADFTEWQPVALVRGPFGAWQTATRVPRGVHRINVRVDGGPWLAPTGTTRLADDDYGGEVGIFVVP